MWLEPVLISNPYFGSTSQVYFGVDRPKYRSTFRQHERNLNFDTDSPMMAVTRQTSMENCLSNYVTRNETPGPWCPSQPARRQVAGWVSRGERTVAGVPSFPRPGDTPACCTALQHRATASCSRSACAATHSTVNDAPDAVLHVQNKVAIA